MEKASVVQDFERQIEALEKKVEELQSGLNSLRKEHDTTRGAFRSFVAIYGLESIISFVVASSSWSNTAAVDEFSKFVKQTKNDLDSGFLPEPFHDVVKAFLTTMIAFARAKNVPFDSVAAILIRDLGDPYAKQLVDVTALVQAYGVANANEWKRMVGIS